MTDFHRTHKRRESENIVKHLCRVLKTSSLTQKFKYLVIFSLCVWILVACQFFINTQRKFKSNLLDPAQGILFEKQNAEMLSEKLKNSVFVNLREWINVSKNLQDIWSRLLEMENKIDAMQKMLNARVATVPPISSQIPVNYDRLCRLTPDDDLEFPACTEKIKWMENFWGSDACYKEHGVDGSLCSIRNYLGEIENWCPPLHPNLTSGMSFKKPLPSPVVQASWNKNLSSLMEIMMEPPSRNNYEWILDRIVRLWHLWVAAVKNIEKEEQRPRTQKKILIYLGFLSKKSGFRFQQTVSAGGPLGELVQWSDILSALFTLGHKMTVTSEYEELTEVLSTLPDIKSQCQTREKLAYDMIVTDIVGLTHFKRHVKQGYGKFSCLLRIIDTFGTEASYNNINYVKQHRQFKTSWGGQELNLKQFYTMFPHSPDNSFMGFVVEQFLNSTELTTLKKKNQAVVYGKSKFMWNGKEEYLKVISKYVEIHATVYTESGGDSGLPSFVKNHGILSGADLQRLLLESKLFIGLGFPYEGPAPLEAIAAGCVFINPMFNPPHSSKNTKFFKGKPTGRELTSQHPYAEDFISEPHVFTIDINNNAEVERAVQEALRLIDNGTIEPYLPFEFTHRGMLERLNSYLEHQYFCPKNEQLWPPGESVTAVVSKQGQSCKDVCWSQKLICEPGHFKNLNKKDAFNSLSGFKCNKFENAADLVHPSFDNRTGTCYLQGDKLMYSCVDSVQDLNRICPCRKFIRGQMALCPGCY